MLKDFKIPQCSSRAQNLLSQHTPAAPADLASPNGFPLSCARPTASLGSRFSQEVVLDLDATWAESDPRTPLVCFLSVGADPSSQIFNLAKAKNVGE